MSLRCFLMMGWVGKNVVFLIVLQKKCSTLYPNDLSNLYLQQFASYAFFKATARYWNPIFKWTFEKFVGNEEILQNCTFSFSWFVYICAKFQRSVYSSMHFLKQPRTIETVIFKWKLEKFLKITRKWRNSTNFLYFLSHDLSKFAPKFSDLLVALC